MIIAVTMWRGVEEDDNSCYYVDNNLLRHLNTDKTGEELSQIVYLLLPGRKSSRPMHPH